MYHKEEFILLSFKPEYKVENIKIIIIFHFLDYVRGKNVLSRLYRRTKCALSRLSGGENIYTYVEENIYDVSYVWKKKCTLFFFSRVCWRSTQEQNSVPLICFPSLSITRPGCMLSLLPILFIP